MPDVFGLKTIAAIVPSKDMKRSFRFYELLGFSVEPYQDGSIYAFLRMDSAYIHLRKANENELFYNPGGLYLYVNDVDAFYARVLANGITTLSRPEDQEWKMREFALSDPDGLLIRVGHNLG